MEDLNNSLVIYGAGAYAKRLYTYMRLSGRESEIIAFVVSDMSGNPEQLYGKPIIKIDDSEAVINGRKVCIAISEKKASGIRNLVEHHHPAEIVCISDDEYVDMLAKIKKAALNVPINDSQVFVDNYFGMGYRCNCKYIVEYLLKKECPVEIIWDITDDQEAKLPDGVRKVVSGMPEYYEALYGSRIYLTNCGPRSFYEKRPDQYMIDTWHGTGPFKKAGMAVNGMSDEKKESLRHQFNQIDLFISNSKDNTEMYRESFEFKKEIMECGYPRNDIFFDEQAKEEINRRVRVELGLDYTQKVLLYVPTFRDMKEKSIEQYDLDMEMVLGALKTRFGDEYRLLYRFHHALYQYGQFSSFYENAVDVTLYEDIQELLVVADVLITDYSSVMWDFSLMRKPVFLYQNDAETYMNDRGFYWPPAKWPYPKAHTSEEMRYIIEQFDDDEYQKKLDMFFTEDPSYDDGHASEKVAERIMDVIQHPEKYGKAVEREQ